MKATLVALLLCGGVFPLPSECAAQSMPEMRVQAARELETADVELNKLYQELLREHAGDKAYVTNLKEAQ